MRKIVSFTIVFFSIVLSSTLSGQGISENLTSRLINLPDTSWRSRTNQELRVHQLPPYIVSKNLSEDPLIKLGYLNVKHYAKGDGKTDDTEMIRKALEDAFNYELVIYFPGGTYLISGTLDCFKKFKSYTKGFFLQGDPGNRPVIKLIDNAPGFGDEAKPAYILKLWQWDIRSSREDKEFGPALMNSASVSSIILDCGQGNPGAIGLKSWGSQGIYVENLEVRAYGALAGIQGLIGNGGYMANISVYGGKIGVWANNGQPGCIVGLTLINQENEAIRQEMGSWPFSIVGFKITKETGPVITIGKKPKQSNGFHLSLVDGTIELKNKSTALVVKRNEENRAGNLYLRDVYIRNASILIDDEGNPSVEPAAKKWSHIHEFSNSGFDTENYIDRNRITGSVISVDNFKPPVDLVSRHSLSRKEMPFGLDKDVISVKDPVLGKYQAKGDGYTDDTEALQYAIDHYSKVFLPKGDYRTSAPLLLKSNTVFFGITSALAALIPDANNWKKNAERVMISTVDDPDANTLFSQFMIYTSSTDERGGVGVLSWHAGRNSVVKNIYTKSIDWPGIGWPSVPTVWEDGDLRPVNIQQLVKISGNGGGRWYGSAFGCENYYPVVPPLYHHVLISNTSQPLRMYSFNPEHACSESEVMITNCRNIQIFGIKTEHNDGCEFNTFGSDIGYLFSVINSDNIFITAGCNNGKSPQTGKSLYRIVNCTNTAITALSTTPRYRGVYDIISEETNGVLKITIPVEKNVGVYRIGDPILKVK